MRHLPLLIFTLLPLACTPVPESRRPHPEPSLAPSPMPARIARESSPPRQDAPTSTPSPAPKPAPTVQIRAPRLIQEAHNGISFTLVAFDSRTHRFVLIDQPAGPGSRYTDARAAGATSSALAAANAGFFTPEGDPLGLVVSSGESTGAWNTASSLGSAVWHEAPGGACAISRRNALSAGQAKSMRELLQAGPMLVDGGKPVTGLENAKHSARTFLLWDGGSRWCLGLASPCTLHALSNTLADASPAGWPVRRAMNLDGGRSSDLWVSSSVSGGPATIRPLWNRPVRNFIAIVPR